MTDFDEPITKEQEAYLSEMLMLGYVSGSINERELYVLKQMKSIEIQSKGTGIVSLIIGGSNNYTSQQLTRTAREQGAGNFIINHVKNKGIVVRAILNFRTTNAEDAFIYERTDTLNDEVSIRRLRGTRFMRIGIISWIKPEIFLRHRSVTVSDLQEPDQEQ